MVVLKIENTWTAIVMGKRLPFEVYKEVGSCFVYNKPKLVLTYLSLEYRHDSARTK